MSSRGAGKPARVTCAVTVVHVACPEYVCARGSVKFASTTCNRFTSLGICGSAVSGATVLVKKNDC